MIVLEKRSRIQNLVWYDDCIRKKVSYPKSCAIRICYEDLRISFIKRFSYQLCYKGWSFDVAQLQLTQDMIVYRRIWSSIISVRIVGSRVLCMFHYHY